MIKKVIILTISLILMSLPYTYAATETQHTESLPLITVIPFILMLLSIAIVPLIKEHWWESNWNKLIISLVLGIPMGIYILFHDYLELIETMEEYISFIIYVGSLFIVSGGIILRGDL